VSREVIHPFKFTLNNLDALPGEAQAHAEAHKFSVENFMTERVAKCAADLDTFEAGHFAGKAPDRVIKVTYPPGKGMYAAEYLCGRQIPNFFFHVTTAYALLRRGGVPIGKGDSLGALTILDL